MQALGERPYAVIAAIVIGAVLLLVRVASPALNAHDLGAIVGPVQDDWWRYLVAPFVYPDIGYLFVVSIGIAIFGTAVEQRLGLISTVVLMIACGALGMLAADGIETAFASHNDVLLAAGGNGIALGLLAAWAVMRAGEVRAHPDEDVELIGAAVAAAVLILLPLVDDYANVFAGLAGALVGAACGGLASLLTSRAPPRLTPAPWRTTSSSPSRPISTATRWSTAPSATAWCPRSSRRARRWATWPRCRSRATRPPS